MKERIGDTLPEVVNGWTISQKTLFNGGNWQAVKNGVIGIKHKDYLYVVAWARTNR